MQIQTLKQQKLPLSCKILDTFISIIYKGWDHFTIIFQITQNLKAVFPVCSYNSV